MFTKEFSESLIVMSLPKDFLKMKVLNLDNQKDIQKIFLNKQDS